jgi:hypothetical protein
MLDKLARHFPKTFDSMRKTRRSTIQGFNRAERADTVVEVLVGACLLALALASLFAGMSMSTGLTQFAREDLRATQIMVERTEAIRLFNWNQLIYSNTLCPASFTSFFFPIPNSSGSTGVTYYGTMSISNVVLSPATSYSDQMRQITVTLNWTNAGLAHSRSMTTYQAQYGMQNYSFNN